MKKAIVTGASSGIGEKIAGELGKRGYYVILVSRNGEKLKAVLSGLENGGEVYATDLSDPQACVELYRKYRNEDIEILVNNAGFGVFGEFSETDFSTELEMLSLNIYALHILG